MTDENQSDLRNTFILKDAKPSPDVFFEYSSDLKRNKTPLVVDLGSCMCRVGWATQKQPCLVFKSVLARVRKEKGRKLQVDAGEVQVGNEIVNIEAVRFQLKTPFDRNIVTQFEAMEHIFDYIFHRLGINTDGKVDHPILITEAFVNLNYSRHLMSELLFETYNVPSVSYGVDGLFSYRLHANRPAGVLINLGFHTIHVIPILNGKSQPDRSRRINLGGFHIIGFLHRLLQLKYPAHANAITISRAEEIVHDHCLIAENYTDELKKWTSMEYYDKNVHVIQLAYVAPVVTPALSADQQKERKKELQRRLIEINARKREEKLHQEEELLNQLLDARELLETGQMKALKRALANLNVPDVAALSRAVTASQQTINKIREKIHSASIAADTPEELKPAPPSLPERGKEEIEAMVAQLREEREELLTKRAARRQRRRDLAQRRTAAAQERMRLISQLARKDKKEDNFGMKDEDWDVYKAINKDGGSSDSEEEMERLTELESGLKQYDPAFEPQGSEAMAPGESHQLHVATERIRAPELIFQPSMIGSHEAGLAETLEFVLKRFTAEEQTQLVSNIYVTGGCASFPGFVPRLERELKEIRPFQSTFKVSLSPDPGLGAWHGAKKFAQSQAFRESLVTREMYGKRGGEFFKEHPSSNFYYPTPAALSTSLNETF